MKTFRKIIEIDSEKCDGCGLCIPGCAEGALEIVDGKARVIEEKYCDGLGACIGECPQGALKIVERRCRDFDPEAVEVLLAKKKVEDENPKAPPIRGCPSARINNIAPKGGAINEDGLSQWPIQIRLVPFNAPFLKNADLLVAADCAPAAFPKFHRRLLKNRVLLLGCPKFDDVNAYTDKFAAIFAQNNIRSVTLAVMGVPCCGGLPMIIQRAMERAQKSIPMDVVVIDTSGRRIKSGVDGCACAPMD